ncbi:MAG: hypothetical protein EOM12_15745 [Verrucomicrobiae bacterium]|nr:hypothetical protein [Verrucomicrobiae bacterium]
MSRLVSLTARSRRDLLQASFYTASYYQPTLLHDCNDVAKAYISEQEELIVLGEECLRHTQKSPQCEKFSLALGPDVRSKLSDLTLLCLQNGGIGRKDAARIRSVTARADSVTSSWIAGEND